MEILNRVDSLVAAEPAVDSRTVISGFGFIGGQGPSYGSIIIKLKDWEERSMMQNSDIVVGTLFYACAEDHQGCAGIVLCSSYDSGLLCIK